MKGLSELKGLVPFSWDGRIDDHPAGEAAMRDFQGEPVQQLEHPRPAV